MNIEEGKQYVRRDGVITGPFEKNPHRLYPWRDPGMGRIYTNNGCYYAGETVCDADLIAEYEEDGEDFVADDPLDL